MINKNIFVLGNSCSGKSLFCRVLLGYLDSYSFEYQDDYEILKQIFKLNKELKDMSNKQRNIFLTELFLSKKRVENHEYQDLKKLFSNQKMINEYEISTIFNDDGSFNIINQEIWHVILELLFEKGKNKNKIIEFARGDSDIYLNHFNINLGEHYKYHLSMLATNKKIELSNTFIVYITSPLNIRILRSYKRKREGGHFVSEDTMKEVYKNDSFLHTMKKYKKKQYILINNVKVPIYVINNSKNLTAEKRFEFFNKESEGVIETFNLINN